MTDDELLAILTGQTDPPDTTAMRYVEQLKLPLLYRYLKSVYPADHKGMDVSMTQLVTLLQNAGIQPFPDGVVPDFMFKDDKAMVEFDFEGIDTVSQSAFFNSGLQSANLKGVQNVGYGAFFGSAISELKLNAVKNIDGYGFAKCKNLQELYIPATCTNIGEHAFANCRGLVSVALDFDQGKPSVEKDAFENCTSLQEIYMHEINIMPFTGIPVQNIMFYIIDNGAGSDYKKNVMALYPDANPDNISLVK